MFLYAGPTDPLFDQQATPKPRTLKQRMKESKKRTFIETRFLRVFYFLSAEENNVLPSRRNLYCLVKEESG